MGDTAAHPTALLMGRSRPAVVPVVVEAAEVAEESSRLFLFVGASEVLSARAIRRTEVPRVLVVGGHRGALAPQHVGGSAARR